MDDGSLTMTDRAQLHHDGYALLRQALRDTWQRDSFDHLVNNAGHGDMASIAETTEAQFDALVNVHFKGVFFLTQVLLPLMADGARIVNISSGLTRIAYPGFAAYSAVKGALEVLSVYLAKELGSRGIAVNTVAPGAIRTDFLGGAVRDMPDLNKVFADMTALGPAHPAPSPKPPKPPLQQPASLTNPSTANHVNAAPCVARTSSLQVRTSAIRAAVTTAMPDSRSPLRADRRRSAVQRPAPVPARTSGYRRSPC